MNRKTALIAITVSLAVLGILTALVGPSGGNVKAVERSIQSTDRYTEADILSAFNAIETEFASEFEGCTLEEVRYDSEVETQHLDEILEHGQKGKGDLIVVVSEFTTDRRASDEGFSPNGRYEDWQWILTRPSQDTPWKVVDWGY